MRPLSAVPFLLALLPVVAADAQRAPAKRSARDAAATFTLDPASLASDATPEHEAVSAPDAPARPPVTTADPAPAPASSAAAPAGAVTLFTLDTPIATLLADPGARGVIDRDLPGLSGDANLDKFRDLTLRQFQPLTGGQLTAALLARVGGDLAALAGTPGAAPPAPVAGRKTRRDGTGR